MRMLKMRVALMGVSALLTVSGLAASTASAAPVWHVNGTRLAQGAVRQLKLQAKSHPLLRAENAAGTEKVEIECKASVSEGATIENQGNIQGQGKGRVSYSSCEVLNRKNAKLQNP